MYVNKSKIKSVGLKASHTSTNIQGGRNATFENKAQFMQQNETSGILVFEMYTLGQIFRNGY